MAETDTTPFYITTAISYPNGRPHIGHAYIAGRDHAKARLAALLDAALQDSALHQACMQAVVEPLAAVQQAARAAEARKAAATRVDFFTMATMR